MAVEHFGHAWETTTIETMKSTIDWLKETTHQENQAILAAGQRFEALKQMATTLVIAVIFDDQIVLGNLGDSKAFLLHDQVLTQISCDHNLKNELVRAGTMSRAEAERLAQANSVTRYLGVDDRADIEIAQYPFVANDMLFLTSDGITKVLDVGTMTDIMQQATTLDMRAYELISAANRNGAPDNVTALLVSRDNE